MISNNNNNNNNSTTIGFCKICKAVIQERKKYMPTTCEACQKFFRRNAARFRRLICKSGTSNCNVEEKRRVCSKCRFEKCLRNGMKSKFMRMDGVQKNNNNSKNDNNNNESSFSTSTSSSSPSIASSQRQSTSSDVQVVAYSQNQIDYNPLDESFTSAERLFKAAVTAYTELSAIDQVCCYYSNHFDPFLGTTPTKATPQNWLKKGGGVMYWKTKIKF